MFKIVLTAILTAFAALFAADKVFDKRVDRIHAQHRAYTDSVHSNAFHAGYNAARDRYQRHPHIHCTACFPTS